MIDILLTVTFGMIAFAILFTGVCAMLWFVVMFWSIVIRSIYAWWRGDY